MGVGMDLFAVKKDGTEFPVEVSLGSYQNNGVENVIAFISDISIRKKAQAEGADLFISKPFTRDVIDYAIKKLL